jgi:hypothetical protein
MKGRMAWVGALLTVLAAAHAGAQDTQGMRNSGLDASVVQKGGIAPPRVAVIAGAVQEPFEEITLRLGRERQRHAYRTSLGL